MNETLSSVKVAVVQAASVLFDRDASLEKACGLVREAAANGAKLVLLPETFIPGYPRGLSFGMVVGYREDEGRRVWQRFWENAVEVPGPVTDALGDAAREAGVYLAIGVTERDTRFGGGTLYCTILFFGPEGTLLGRHRKLMPTAAERLIWGEGDGSTLTVLDTEFGKMGALVCWENYMPMARMAMYAKGVNIYLAPTADPRDTWQASMRHIAFEGRCFVLGCNQFVTRDGYPETLASLPEMAGRPEVICRGGSVIVSPSGEVLAGPLYDREGILYANLDLGEIVRGKVDFDAAGHYSRPDVFRLHVNESPRIPVECDGERNG